MQADDVALWSALRASQNPWARRVVERRGFSLVVESNPFEQEVDLAPLEWALRSEGIEHFSVQSRGVLSKYAADAASRAPLFVRSARSSWERIEEYTPLFKRYADGARLVRLYVDPSKRDRARQLAGPMARS